VIKKNRGDHHAASSDKESRLPLHGVNDVRCAVSPILALLIADSFPSNGRLSVEDEDNPVIVSVKTRVTLDIVRICSRTHASYVFEATSNVKDSRIIRDIPSRVERFLDTSIHI
jgi:hypothetical protein